MKKQALMTAGGAAKVAGVTPAAIRAAIKTGRLPVAMTVSGIRLLNLKAVQAYAAQRQHRKAA